MLGALMSHRPACIVSRVVRARVGHLCSLAWLAWIACALLAAPARADGPAEASAAPAVAIIHIDITGDYSPDLMEQIDAALVRALAGVGFSGVSHESVQAEFRGQPGLADCQTPDCLQKLPEHLGTSQFLRLRVEASSAIYEFELLLLVAEGEGGGVKERRKDTCPVCTSEEFIDRVSDNVRALMQPFQPVPVTLESQPAGARLTIDGRELGSAPFSGKLAPGSHRVRAVLAGHLDAEQVIEVAAGPADAPQRFDIGLTAGPSGGGGEVDGGSAWGMWKWPTAIAAVGAVAVGGYWLSIDGDCSTDPEVSGGECELKYGTQGQGIAAVGVGAALGIAAGLMFWSDSGSGSETKAEAATDGGSAFAPDIVPTRGGAMGTLRFRF
jgi:PEGA domain